MEDLQEEPLRQKPPARFSIPAVVAGLTAPVLVYALSLTGLPGIEPITEALAIDLPASNTPNREDDSAFDIEAAGFHDPEDDANMFVRYSPLEKDVVKAAAESPVEAKDRFWSYGGKRLSGDAVIEEMKKNRSTYPTTVPQPIELNCLNQEALGTQGVIFELYIEGGAQLLAYNRFEPRLAERFASYDRLVPTPTKEDFSACLAFRKEVEDALGPRRK